MFQATSIKIAGSVTAGGNITVLGSAYADTIDLSGVLAAGQLGLEPTMGTGLLMPSFIAIIVGGIGSLPGTLAGGLLIGVASGVTAVFFPAASEAVIYVMMAVILLTLLGVALYGLVLGLERLFVVRDIRLQ